MDVWRRMGTDSVGVDVDHIGAAGRRSSVTLRQVRSDQLDANFLVAAIGRDRDWRRSISTHVDKLGEYAGPREFRDSKTVRHAGCLP